MAKAIRAQLKSGQWSRRIRAEAIEVAEHLMSRALLEEGDGQQFGKPGNKLCAWYRITQHDCPDVADYLNEVRFNDFGEAAFWLPGSQWDQPADLLDAADTIRAAGEELTRKTSPKPKGAPT